ncbi:hypothetical protein PRIPAC_78857 [Pristionchus pacificus]|uniref:Uncharacterized protein n=1 Tax=Pristionchus pacificus TaxID=54126 RepID=A0A2A6C230_PRIPA|nr:hypothetical protein PRIPAC_78857 [Pristionchus pacificus]|eukprot:PDM72292.1 hypothetical protein PRIPAC_38726 [Pristionchus pacificus]
MDELPQNKADPPIRLSLHTIGLGTQMIIPIYELFLSAERIISSINPEKYYRRTLSWKLNFFAKKFCTRRFENLETTLNARYQVKEAAEIASSLQTVYVFSIILKFSKNSFKTLTITSIFVMAGFIHLHPRLRRKFEIIRQRFRGVPITIASHSDVFAIQERRGEGDIYFEKLTKSWTDGISSTK